MKRDGWVKEANGVWILRFRYDWDSWDQNPQVLIDRGRLMSNGIPLLKSRKRMRRNLAIVLWKDLLASGWKRINPQWEQLAYIVRLSKSLSNCIANSYARQSKHYKSQLQLESKIKENHASAIRTSKEQDWTQFGIKKGLNSP